MRQPRAPPRVRPGVEETPRKEEPRMKRSFPDDLSEALGEYIKFLFRDDKLNREVLITRLPPGS